MYGFRIPPVIKNLIIINILIYLAQFTMGAAWDARLTELFGLHDVHSQYFRIHQLITYAFLHGNWPHVLYNMLFLWLFGSSLENHWGAKRFLTFYMVSAVGAAVVHLGALYMETNSIMHSLYQYSPDDQLELVARINLMSTVGASGAVFGCMAAMGWLFPNQYLMIYGLFPLKVKWFVLIYAAGELFSGIHTTAGDNVAHWAHLGGGLVGLLLVIYWNKTDRRNFY